MKTYTTVQGDMWDGIAYAQLGDGDYTDKLMSLNKSYIGYYVFPAGISLHLPDATQYVSDILPPWKQVLG